MKRYVSAVAGGLLLAGAGGGTAAACACCAEPGTWRVSIIESNKVVAAARQVRQTGGTAAIGDPGSRHEPEEARKVRLVSAGDRVVIASAKGRITFTPSKTGVLREVDITFAAGRGSAGSAKLLKSYAVLGQARLTGDLAKLMGASQVRATLAVRGVGNNCPDPKDMKVLQLRLRKGSRTVGHVTFGPAR